MSESNSVTASRPHALFAAGTIGASAAFLLCGYEFVRSTSDTLVMDAYGLDGKTYCMAVVPVGVLLLLYGYARLLSAFGPRKTLGLTSLLSGAAIFGCYLAIRSEIKIATAVLYILREGYIVILIEQYWSFLDSTLGHEGAKKWNGPICGVGSLGSILGGTLVATLSAPLGTANLLLFAAGAVIPAALCSDIAYRRCGEPAPKQDEVAQPHGQLGLRLFRENRVLVLLLLIVLATQIVSTCLELRFSGILKEQIPETDKRNAYSGAFWTQVGIAAGVCQFVVAPLLLRFVAVGWIHLGIPLLHLGACAFLLGSPSLASAGFAYLLFKTLDYSIFRAAKEMLYIPLSFDVRYRAKELIDVFGYRFGKGGTSLGLGILKTAVTFSVSFYTMLALAAAGVWLVLALPISKYYKSK